MTFEEQHAIGILTFQGGDDVVPPREHLGQLTRDVQVGEEGGQVLDHAPLTPLAPRKRRIHTVDRHQILERGEDFVFAREPRLSHCSPSF